MDIYVMDHTLEVANKYPINPIYDAVKHYNIVIAMVIEIMMQYKYIMIPHKMYVYVGFRPDDPKTCRKTVVPVIPCSTCVLTI